ncbi:MAG TPA: dolichyl-phosphate beta-glucosyltransferase [Fimbriimonadaceae bacterium]|nr:dolichyl-phosphate beta-glucosyltransferase [Fimbriimonadaceae bacterium]
MEAPFLSVVIPAYNEEARLGPTLERLCQYYADRDYSFDVTVVSDGSSDRTEAIVEEFAATHPGFRLVAYRPNRGKGCAVRTGMLAAKGEVILFCDADMATPQEETEKLLAHMRDGADVAIGSRPLKESRLERHQPWLREMLGRASNQLIQLLAVRGIHDTQCGFKMFTRESCADVFARCKLDGFSFDFEALMIARDLGYRIDEVPIRWFHQEGSKVVFWRDYPRALRDLVALRLKGKNRRLRFRADNPAN